MPHSWRYLRPDVNVCIIVDVDVGVGVDIDVDADVKVDANDTVDVDVKVPRASRYLLFWGWRGHQQQDAWITKFKLMLIQLVNA